MANIISGASVQSLILVALVLLVLFYLKRALSPGLRNLPGPLLARFSRLYRLSLVADGRAPENYREMHRKYGTIVRTGPAHVSFSDPAAIPIIFGTGSKFLKTKFYSTMSPVYKGETIDSMFTARSPAYHRALKTPVAQVFSMSSMRFYEPYVDECSRIFMTIMQELNGQPLDLAVWLQWYAFDVIAGITFQRRFGFLDQRKDVNDMISRITDILNIVKLLGQYPELDKPIKTAAKYIMPLLGRSDPLEEFLVMSEEEINRYDESEKVDGRTDFLSQLRQREEKLGAGDPHQDLINHLSNNLLAGSDTTAISLRACFYYLIKNPKAEARMLQELRDAETAGTISDPVTLEESLKLQYLQAVMKEAMRLHPGVAFPLERDVPPGGANICGHHFPGGTNVSMTAAVVQIDKDVFGQDAESFRPERWLESDPEQLKNMERSLLFFGHGTRSCIGKNISLMEMGKLIPQVYRIFELEWVSPKSEWKTNAAWFWQQSEMLVKFKLR